jgi:hypothetical protein
MRLWDADETTNDGQQFDLSGLECPKCGTNAVEVLSYPRGDAPRRTADGWEGRWWGGQGKARCEFCNIVFPIQIDEGKAEE